MTTKRIVYATPTGIVIITPNPSNRLPGEAEGDFISRVLARNIEVAAQTSRAGNVVNPHLNRNTEVFIIDASDIPPDRNNRDSWVLKGGKIF